MEAVSCDIKGDCCWCSKGCLKIDWVLSLLGRWFDGVVWEFSDGVPWVSGSKVAWNLGRWSC